MTSATDVVRFFGAVVLVMATLCALGVAGGMVLARVRMRRVLRIWDEETKG